MNGGTINFKHFSFSKGGFSPHFISCYYDLKSALCENIRVHYENFFHKKTNPYGLAFLDNYS